MRMQHLVKVVFSSAISILKSGTRLVWSGYTTVMCVACIRGHIVNKQVKLKSTCYTAQCVRLTPLSRCCSAGMNGNIKLNASTLYCVRSSTPIPYVVLHYNVNSNGGNLDNRPVGLIAPPFIISFLDTNKMTKSEIRSSWSRFEHCSKSLI